MKRLVLALVIALLFFGAPARAEFVDPIFQCDPDSFRLEQRGDRFTLYGTLTAEMPGTDYVVEPVSNATRGGMGETTLTLVPPPAAAKSFPSRRVQVHLDRTFTLGVWPISGLRVYVRSVMPFIGPSVIECRQIGGVPAG
jgi:hypothetical protein